MLAAQLRAYDGKPESLTVTETAAPPAGSRGAARKRVFSADVRQGVGIGGF
jgi:hypothetical protein